MKNFAARLYQAMLSELGRCKSKTVSPVEEVECCFQVANRFWNMLREEVKHHRFQNEEEEIRFFKTVKPLFISGIEYYNLRYHAELFKPADPVDRLSFWERESRRLEKFKEENYDFLVYLEAGATVRDCLYFLRSNNKQPSSEQLMFDPENVASTTHDQLVSSLMALERYHLYVNSQLQQIKTE